MGCFIQPFYVLLRTVSVGSGVEYKANTGTVFLHSVYYLNQQKE